MAKVAITHSRGSSWIVSWEDICGNKWEGTLIEHGDWSYIWAVSSYKGGETRLSFMDRQELDAIAACLAAGSLEEEAE